MRRQIRTNPLYGACAAVAVFIGATVVHDDGPAGAYKLVHSAPGGDPRRYPEGAELPDGAFQACDKRLQQFFAVDALPADIPEGGDGAPEVRVVCGVAVHVDAYPHADGGLRRGTRFC